MASDTSLVFNLLARDKTGDGLKSAQGGFAKFGKAMQKAALVGGGAMILAGKQAIDAASDYTEASNKTDAVFKNQAGIIRAFEKESTQAFGISKRAALDYTGAMGSVLTASGVNRKEAAKLSVEYTKLAADLGSFNNTSTEEAAEALKASLTGEFEMLKKYGVVINDTTLAQEAQRLGIEKAGATWSQAQKLQLSYNIVQRATKDAQGDVARNTDTMAFKQRQLAARVEDLKVSVGQKLLPVWIKFLGYLQKGLDWMEKNQSTVKILAGVLIGLTATVLAVSAAIKVYTAVTTAINAVKKVHLALTNSQRLATLALQVQYYAVRAATLAWSAAQWVLNVAMMAAPYILIAAAIVGIIAVVVLIATKTDFFQKLWSKSWGLIKGAVSAVFGWIRSNWPLLLAILTGPFGLAVLAIIRNWDRIKSGASSVVSFVKNKFGALVSFVGGLPGKISRAVSGAFNAIPNGFKAAVNAVISAIRSFGIPGFKIPIPMAPDITFGGARPFAGIPFLAKGGTVDRSGLAVVGEEGPELLSLNRGAQVTPLSGGKGGAQRVEVVLRVDGGDDEIVRMIRKWVRVQTGGNVQAALGR